MDNKERTVEFTADQVWGIAVRVDRDNGGYVKLPVYCEQFDAVKTEPNKVIVNDFQHQALKIAQMDQFTGRNMLEFAIISCLPDVARRDRARAEFMQALYASEPIQGAEGDKISGYFTVEQCRFNPNYNKFRIQGRMGESFVDFWFGRELLAGANLAIKAKIKRQRPDKSTQLNYVKVG
jgi:hypothetical protein